MLHLSVLGIFHTLIGIVALILAIVAFVRDQRIYPSNTLGKGYIILTLIACITSFGVQKLGHLSPSHFLTVLILLVLPVGIYFQRKSTIGKGLEYVGVAAMSFTVFLSFIPTIVETLTRVPVGQPLAPTEDAPIIKMCVLTLVTIFTIVIFLQLRHLRQLRKATA